MMPQDPEKGLTSDSEPEVSEVEDIETLKQALVEEKARAEGYLANWQRTQADLINYKRRAEQEKEETIKFANAVLMGNILPVLDDLERAFSSITPQFAKRPWVDGIRLIEQKLKKSLESQGLSPIKAIGEPFDPHLHEAVRQDKGKEGIVIGELQKGYMLRDRVIRPTKVVVGIGEDKEE